MDWFQNRPMPDLVFMEVHLTDGNAFEIFKTAAVSCPIIFTTTNESYALRAFKVNSIAYLLKPLLAVDIRQALEKLSMFKGELADLALAAIGAKSNSLRAERLLVKKGNSVQLVPMKDVAYFFTDKKTNYLCTGDGKKYPLESNLDEILGMLNPKQYFRINRQFIVGHSAIEEMKAHTRGRVVIKLKPAIDIDTVVSIDRSGEFRAWLGGEFYS